VMQQAAEEVLGRAIRRVAIPKRFSIPMREIWLMQPRFEQQSDGRARRLMGHPRFRAAYDFLLLRAEVGEVPQALADWWTEAQTRLTADRGDDDIGVFDDAVPVGDDAPPRKRRRRRRARTRSETPA
jgi:poly(A) polymerase